MSGIFRAYDIRGIFGKDLTGEIAFKIGAAFGTINPGAIAVGCDARLSSPVLKQKLMEGLASTGASVIDVGMVTTPMMIFAVGFYRTDGGIIVTASHNPKEYNGFKVFTKGAAPVGYDDGLNRMERLVAEKNFAEGSGTVSEKNIEGDYADFVLGKVRFNGTKFKIIVDGGNGAAGKIYSAVLRRAGFNVVELFCAPDGNFPNHIPDPSEPKNLHWLKQKVLDEKADVGLAFDGDGDRLGVVDGDGSVVSGNDVFILLARGALAQHIGGKIAINISCSMAVEDCVRKSGGVPVDCKVGHTFVTQKMAEAGCVFGGELSGHFFFREFFNGDDALLAGLKLLEYLINSNTTIKAEQAMIPRYFSEVAEEVVIPISEELKFPFMERLKSDLIGRGFRVSDLDGVKILFDDGWALFRPSNTTPLIRYGFESRTREGFEKIRKLVEEIKAGVPK